MQNSKLKLQEIVYEVTGRCEGNNCHYCGSQSQWKEKIDENRIMKIVNLISLYPPEEINISGGDPLLVSASTHQFITDKFHSTNVPQDNEGKHQMMVKILINPKSFLNKTEDQIDNYINILKMYDYVGISINETSNFVIKENGYHPLFIDFVSKLVANGKVTFISNFNTINIFLFDEIKNYLINVGLNFAIKPRDIPWTVQYTVYHNENDEKAIYNNESAYKYLKQKIDETINDKNSLIKIMLSDNLNGNECSAGTRVCGITSDGDVVPCLSMRSWMDNIKSVSQGNILSDVYGSNPLKSIWEDEFEKYRFCAFHCCKDHCKNKSMGMYVPKIDNAWSKWSEEAQRMLDELKKRDTIPQVPITVMYGIRPYRVDPPFDDFPKIVAYAVSPMPIITYYLVTTGYGFDNIQWQTTTDNEMKTYQVNNNGKK